MGIGRLRILFIKFTAAWAPLCALCVILAGCNTWVERGPHGSGRVSAIVTTDAVHLWAASPGGGVWKTEDGGANWAEAGNLGLNDFTALDLVLDRTDASRMYLRTWNGFWVSDDGAATWRRTLRSIGDVADVSYFQPFSTCGILSVPCRYSFAALPDFEPRPFAQMLFPGEAAPAQSILLTALPCQGLQYSTDSGEHFTQMWPFPGSDPQTNPENCISSVAADEVTGKVYFATMGRNLLEGVPATHIYRSSVPWTAAGPPASLHWEPVHAGLTSGEPATALVWGGSADRMMAIVFAPPPTNATPYLFNGTTWIPKPFNSSDCNFTDGARSLVYGGGNDFFAGGVNFAYTNNAGDTWVCPNLAFQNTQQHVDIRAIHADRKLRKVWIGGDQSDLEHHFVITSFPWTPAVGLGDPSGMTGHGISSWQTRSVAVGVATQGRRMIVGGQDAPDACSDDNGATWHLLRADEAESVIWPQSNGGNVLYSYSTLGTLQRSDNIRSAPACADIHLADISPDSAAPDIQAFTGPHNIAVHPDDSNKVFIVAIGHLTYTLDGGQKWERASFSVPGYENQPAPTSIFVDEDGVLYVGTQQAGAFVCTDTTSFCGGGSGSGVWTPWGLNAGSEIAPPGMITAITESGPPSTSRDFWMGTTDGVYRRLAGESAWTKVIGNLGAEGGPFYVYNEVVVDSMCRNRIFAGIGYLADFSRTRGGIVFSSDNGASWRSITAGFGLHNVPITQIAIDPGNPLHAHIYASTYGRGVWDYSFDPQDLGSCTPATGDFSLEVTPPQIRNRFGRFDVTVTPVSGFQGVVVLSCSSNSATHCGVFPTAIVGDGTASLTVTSDNDGDNDITVIGTSGALTHSATVTLTVPCKAPRCM